MEGEISTEFQDWEVLVNSDTDITVNSPNSQNHISNEEIEAESEAAVSDSDGVLRLDYFSIENVNRYAKPVPPISDESSVDSDNPSWIDPANDTRFNQINNSAVPAGFWSDSGSDRSDERKVVDLDVKNELGFIDNGKITSGFDGIGEIDCKDGKFMACEGSFSRFDGRNDIGFEGSRKNELSEKTRSFGKDLSKFWSDSGGDSLVFDDVLKVESEILGEVNAENEPKDENLSAVAVGEKKPDGDGDKEKRRVVWWKVPFELLRYCVFKVNPVWTFSMAAAVMGFVILGRRLYKMKRKTRSLPLKVTVDDKKVSQFMSRAARLNEAFSVVRRVPIVRPLLPAPGVNSWPVMTLR